MCMGGVDDRARWENPEGFSLDSPYRARFGGCFFGGSSMGGPRAGSSGGIGTSFGSGSLCDRSESRSSGGVRSMSTEQDDERVCSERTVGFQLIDWSTPRARLRKFGVHTPNLTFDVRLAESFALWFARPWNGASRRRHADTSRALVAI